MIERHATAEFANIVLNDRDVRPDIADVAEGRVDISPQVANRQNVLLCGSHGGFMYFKLMDGIYEVHSFVLPAGRGRWAFYAAMASIDWIFTRTDAFEVMTRIPVGHVAAAGLASKCGFRLEFAAPNGSKWRGMQRDVEVWSLPIQCWAVRATGFEARGEFFHAQLATKALRMGVQEPPHDLEAVHNHYVGIALAMIDAGISRKAVGFYNRWAMAARHSPVVLLNEAPPEIAMDIGVLRFQGKDFELVRPS